MTGEIDIDISRDDNGNGDFDISFTDGDFTLVKGFDTSLKMSLFAEMRADDSERPVPHQRGWWGNKTNPIPLREIGSKLWLLEQARNTPETLQDAIGFCKEALNWLIEDGHLDDVEVTGSQTVSDIDIEIRLIRDSNIVNTFYFTLWENTGKLD